MNRFDENYKKLVETIFTYGQLRKNRTGVDTIGIFGYQLRFDLSKGTIPLLTTKKISPRLPIEEMLWFLSGETNIKPLVDKNIHIWDAWASKEGELGNIYGSQWRKWYLGIDKNGSSVYLDQIIDLINNLRNNPFSRRHIVSAWNVADLPEETFSPQQNVEFGLMALAPCHFAFQCYVNNQKQLSLHLNLRSSDTFLGLPFNIFQYAVLQTMLAKQTGLSLGELIVTIGDSHIYVNHIELLQKQLSRVPFQEPEFRITTPRNFIFDYKFEDFEIIYESHPGLVGTVAV